MAFASKYAGSGGACGVGDLHMYITDPRRPRGHAWTTNRQDSTGAAAMVASSISRIKKINFFAPQLCSRVPPISLDQ